MRIYGNLIYLSPDDIGTIVAGRLRELPFDFEFKCVMSTDLADDDGCLFIWAIPKESALDGDFSESFLGQMPLTSRSMLECLEDISEGRIEGMFLHKQGEDIPNSSTTRLLEFTEKGYNLLVEDLAYLAHLRKHDVEDWGSLKYSDNGDYKKKSPRKILEKYMYLK